MSSTMNSTGLDLAEMVKVKMAYSAERQKVLAQNIANVDTPGYRAKDLTSLDFKNTLAAKTASVPMAITSSMHQLGSKPQAGSFRSQLNKTSFEVTPTGGTVVIEEQMMKVAQNATDYQMTTSLYNKIGNMYRTALGLPAGG